MSEQPDTAAIRAKAVAGTAGGADMFTLCDALDEARAAIARVERLALNKEGKPTRYASAAEMLTALRGDDA